MKDRLESIKERNKSLHPSKRIEYDNPLELALTWTRNYWSDTYYLLQRLDIAQKALEQIQQLQRNIRLDGEAWEYVGEFKEAMNTCNIVLVQLKE